MKLNKLFFCVIAFTFVNSALAQTNATTTTSAPAPASVPVAAQPTAAPATLTAPAAVTNNTAAEQLANLMSSFQSMQANFTQNVYDSDGYLMQQSSGQMALQRPGKFRWQILKPNQELLLADGTNVWIYNVALQQVTKQTLSGRKASDPATLLSGSVESIQQRFNTSFMNNANSSGTWFQLVPKAQDDMFKWIQLHFSNNQLDQMKLSDNLGQVSVFKFSNIKTNATLDPQLFVFKAPPGVDVINASSSSTNGSGQTTSAKTVKHTKKKHK